MKDSLQWTILTILLVVFSVVYFSGKGQVAPTGQAMGEGIGPVPAESTPTQASIPTEPPPKQLAKVNFVIAAPEATPERAPREESPLEVLTPVPVSTPSPTAVPAQAPEAATGDALGDTIILIEEQGFNPPDITIQPGTVVTWRNAETVRSHTVKSASLFFSGRMPPGAVFSYTFTEPGTYHYFDGIFKYWSGTVTVAGGDADG